MKLKIYDQTNSKCARTNEIAIHVSKRSGVISFSKGATEFFELNAGDKICIANDEQSPKDWYVNKTDSENGFTLRSKDGKIATFNCAKVAHEILKSLGIKNGATFKIAKQATEIEDVKYYALLTSNPINAR